MSIQTKLPEPFLSNPTEIEIIRILVENGPLLSPYSISKRTNYSYPGIFKYCKKLEEKRMLSSISSDSKKKQKKNEYSVTDIGFSYYISQLSDDDSLRTVDLLQTYRNLNPVFEFLLDIITSSDKSTIFFEFFIKMLKSVCFSMAWGAPSVEITIVNFCDYLGVWKGSATYPILDCSYEEFIENVLIPISMYLKKYPKIETDIRVICEKLAENAQKSIEQMRHIFPDIEVL